MLNISFDEKISHSLGEMARLRRFDGPPVEFWPAFLSAAGTLARADRTSLTFSRHLVELGERAAREGSVLQMIEQAAPPELKHFGLAVKLALNRPEDTCIAVFLLLNQTEAQAQEALLRLQLTADTPFSYLLSQSSTRSKGEAEKFAASLDVLALLNAEKKFLGAGLALCNALASRYGCDRVSLGWLENGYIKLKNISRTERFDRAMSAVKALELTMEECVDQDDEILCPAPERATFVNRDHEKFAQEHKAGNMCSVPIRVDNSATAVLTCERKSAAFEEGELQQLRLACDQASRRLADLKERDGWLGVRMARGARRMAAKVVGPERTWTKVLAILATLAAFVLVFGKFNYRVEGNYLLKSDAVSFLTAPFDGFIKEVNVKPGDVLTAGATILQLDTDDLALEEAAALADQARYQREAEKARATNGLAEMRIALALAEQSKARLELARHRIRQSSITAPFAGVLVEGDLRERIGAPVKQGDALFKVSKLEGIYVEAEIDQRDVHEIKPDAVGEIAFVTQPKLKYRVQVERIYPAAFPKEGENIFIVRCKLLDAPADWWRPGMSGLVKLESGERTLLWILTHRTVDFLRMWFWW